MEKPKTIRHDTSEVERLDAKISAIQLIEKPEMKTTLELLETAEAQPFGTNQSVVGISMIAGASGLAGAALFGLGLSQWGILISVIGGGVGFVLIGALGLVGYHVASEILGKNVAGLIETRILRRAKYQELESCERAQHRTQNLQYDKDVKNQKRRIRVLETKRHKMISNKIPK